MNTNHKPALEFDQKYGTSISQEWKFPFDMMADDVWNLITTKIGYRVEPQVKRFVDALTIEHFPYRDLDNWVVSRKTFEKIKEQLGNERFIIKGEKT